MPDVASRLIATDSSSQPKLSDQLLDPMTAPLVDELRVEVADLLKRIDAQIEQPTVQPFGLLGPRGLGGTISSASPLQTRNIGGDGSGADG